MQTSIASPVPQSPLRSSLLGSVSLALTLNALTLTASAAVWLTLPNPVTHSRKTGARVNQEARMDAPPIKWGAAVWPSGEWRFPYQPDSAPDEARGGAVCRSESRIRKQPWDQCFS